MNEIEKCHPVNLSKIPAFLKKQKKISQVSFFQKLNISPQLAAFLKLENGERVTRVDINTAITMYINVSDRKNVSPEKRKWLERMNPDSVNRCLQSEIKSIIIPDEALSNLLNYPAYQQRVKDGKQLWRRRNQMTGEFESVVETNDKLSYFIIPYLLAPHLLGLYNPESETKN